MDNGPSEKEWQDHIDKEAFRHNPSYTRELLSLRAGFKIGLSYVDHELNALADGEKRRLGRMEFRRGGENDT